MKPFSTTALLAVLSLAGGIAVAQPADGPPPTPPPPPADAPAGPGGQRPGMMGERRGGEGGGPYMKIMAASKLGSLTEDQKTKVNALLEEKKAEAQAMREELRTAMEQARNATDRQARQAAMEPLRQKHQAAQQQVDAALAAILTPEQMTELNQKAADWAAKGREGMGRRGGPDDRSTTGAKSEDRGDRGDRKGKRGGDKPGKRGDKSGKENKAGSQSDAATTGTQQVNPFSTE